MSAKWKGFSSTIRAEEARNILLEHINNIIETERISVFDAFNRKLSCEIVSDKSLPGFKRSAMDGYAVKSRNTFGASDTSPIQLRISGKTEIGDTEKLELTDGAAIRISTGAPLPDNADAVIKIEECEEINEFTLEIYSSVASGKNVANEDEDVKINEIIFSKNHLILPWDLALLVSLGIQEVDVYRKPKVAILSTGSELVAINEVLKLGQVVDSNRPAIEVWCRYLGAEIAFSETCVDEVDEITDRLNKFAGNCDLIITTGGTSVGTRDYMAEIISKNGKHWVNGISIRPGKPVIVGQVFGTLIIALPGYPLAAFINFDIFVVLALQYWTGMSSYWEHETDVKLNQSIASNSGTRDMVRLVDAEDGADLVRITGAGILSSLTRADYLLEIPEDLEGYNKGSEVKVRRLRK